MENNEYRQTYIGQAYRLLENTIPQYLFRLEIQRQSEISRYLIEFNQPAFFAPFVFRTARENLLNT